MFCFSSSKFTETGIHCILHYQLQVYENIKESIVQQGKEYSEEIVRNADLYSTIAELILYSLIAFINTYNLNFFVVE